MLENRENFLRYFVCLCSEFKVSSFNAHFVVIGKQIIVINYLCRDNTKLLADNFDSLFEVAKEQLTRFEISYDIYYIAIYVLLISSPTKLQNTSVNKNYLIFSDLKIPLVEKISSKIRSYNYINYSAVLSNLLFCLSFRYLSR